jgi:ParB family chromosome partitioning protein
VGGLRFEEIPISAIRPNAYQPRRTFSEAAIRELAASIREVGILQPLVIRPVEGGFELIAGERRLRAAREAGLERVPVLIREAADNESMELALVENLQRQDLNPIETANAYQALMEGFGLTKEQLALRMGKSRAAVTNTLRLNQLPQHVRRLVEEGQLSEGHARALLGLGSADRMLGLAERIVTERLSVRRTEELVREDSRTPQQEEQSASRVQQQNEPDRYEEATRRIQEVLLLPIRIRSARKGGKIEIKFHEQEELDALLARLVPEPPSS